MCMDEWMVPIMIIHLAPPFSPHPPCPSSSPTITPPTDTPARHGVQVVVERKEDEEGNQWFEMTQESCDLIGLQVRPSLRPSAAFPFPICLRMYT